MTPIRSAAIAALVSSTLILGAAPAAVAGVLNGHAAAFGGIAGTVAFNDGFGLAGTVDYAVFTAGAFNANFGGLGYVPGDGLVYTYQIESTGRVDVVALEVILAGAANTIGSFDIGDVGPTASAFVGGDAQWLFGDTLSAGQSSWGLAFSTPDEPIVGFYEVFGEAASTLVAGIPTPHSFAVPEPGTLGLLLSAALAGLGWRRRRLHAAP
jgi:hypothetical protein